MNTLRLYVYVIKQKSWLITVRKRSHSVHRGRSATGQTPLGKHPLGRHPPQADTLYRQTPPPPATATAVDGTHPTGMHSCSTTILLL